MTNSQQKTLDWYKKNSTWFDNIISEKMLPNKRYEVDTPTHTYEIGIRGGLHNTKIK